MAWLELAVDPSERGTSPTRPSAPVIDSIVWRRSLRVLFATTTSPHNPTLIQRLLDAPTDYPEACLSFCDLVPRCHATAQQLAHPHHSRWRGSAAPGRDNFLTRALELMAGCEPVDDRRQTSSGSWLADGIHSNDRARKLEAWKAGRPLSRYDTIHHAIHAASSVLIVAFVRMAGESRPWGIAGHSLDPNHGLSRFPTAASVTTSLPCVQPSLKTSLNMRVHNWTFDPVPSATGVG